MTSTWQVPSVAPLSDAAWAAWLAKGVAADLRGYELRIKALKMVTAAALLISSVATSAPADYWLAFRCAVVLATIFAMTYSLRRRHVVYGAIFAAVIILYNPFFELIPLSGEWGRALLIGSAIPFLTSIFGRTTASDRRA